MRSEFSSPRGAEANAENTSTGAAASSEGHSHGDFSQYLVPPAMLVVAVAMAVAAHLHMGLAAEMAAAVGVALFCLMLLCHVLLRMADDAERAAEDAAERGIGQVSSPMPVEPPSETSSVEPIGEVAQAEADNVQISMGPVLDARGSAPANLPSPPQITVEHGVGEPGWSFRPVDLMQPEATLPAAPVALDAPGLRSLGEFRPTYAEHKLEAGGDAGEVSPSLDLISVDREADRIDAILKRLATQIHAGAAERQQQTVGPVAEKPGSVASRLPSPTGIAEVATSHPQVESRHVPLEELAAVNPDSALASAVDALRSTVEAMRGTPVSIVPDPSAAEVSVAAVAEAIQAESADVFLSPILGLAEQSARHFEVSVKLRVDTGDERKIAEGAGLLPLLDALNVRHAAGFASMLGRRGRDGAVFSQVGGRSLESDRFVSDVAGRHAQGVANRMVLAFAQDEMRGLGPAQLAALEDLARLGFRFSLQGIADLDMDFEALQSLGFEFVKLDAAVFQAGLFCDGETVSASEICEHFEGLGLAVIVADIVDAETRDRLLGWGVVYGQGALFGAPRPVPVATPAASTIAA
jgi:EAL domain-containing protein (putative c-di-GMP-specific phosphodiesterase class I)